tara:strand:- start:579 stop:764 length:186 start_codon:yes stop_codon:yes gene_type:complete
MTIYDTLELIQANINRMLTEMNRSEEQFLRSYADSRKIQLAYAMGQREMLGKFIEATQEEE